MSEKPRIIVDEDWKSRVQAEKEQVPPPAAEPAPAAAPPSAPDPASDSAAVPLPPASFTTLVSSLVTEAMVALGQIADAAGRHTFRREQARHSIDTLAMLEDKTRGNLTADEAALLSHLLHELRLAFVELSRRA